MRSFDSLPDPGACGFTFQFFTACGPSIKPNVFFFLILLGTPALVTVLSGMMGPPRAYIYMFPFLILLAALGIDRGIGFLSRFVHHTI